VAAGLLLGFAAAAFGRCSRRFVFAGGGCDGEWLGEVAVVIEITTTMEKRSPHEVEA
jgi:hypothetical protein